MTAAVLPFPPNYGLSPQPPVLTTERLTLRALDASDLDAGIAFFMTQRAQFVGGGADKDEGHAFRVMAILTGHWQLCGFGLFTIVETATGRRLGAVGPFYPAGWPERELGWTLWDASFEGKGFAHEAATALRDHLMGPCGWPTLVSYINPDNAPSIALAERMGATLDTQAARPTDTALVYRHPAPGDRP